jgi:hypothetical protein
MTSKAILITPAKRLRYRFDAACHTGPDGHALEVCSDIKKATASRGIQG